MKQSLRFGALCCAAVLLCGSPAMAQATRTWVSSVSPPADDANPCSRTAPCKTFAGAITKTAAGGEISVLDPGGYGAVTITKAITLSGDGTLASILAGGTSGITVLAGASDKVIVRNLSINGAGTTPGTNGIRFLSGKQLNVEHVTIYGFISRGIDVSVGAAAELYVTDTNITNCLTGIRLASTAGQLLATLDNVRLENMTNGLLAATGNSFATVRHSNISGNDTVGVQAQGATTVINVEDSMLSFNNGSAADASAAGATLRLSGNAFYNNQADMSAVVGATIASDGTNRSAGNTITGAPTTSIVVH